MIAEPISLDGSVQLPDKSVRQILQIFDLSVGYESMVLLNVSRLSIQAGEVVAIVGRSGCGKTTLLSCLSGDLQPLAGTYYLNGSYRGQGLRNTFTSRTLQAFPLLHWLTVKENLALAARIRGVVKPDVGSILANFAAENLQHRFPATLSGGERCRASLSQALLGDPRMLLLDEPFTGLDLRVKQIVAGNLFRLARASEAAVIFITHDLHDAMEFSDRVIAVGGHRPATVIGEIIPESEFGLKKLRELLLAHQ